MTDPATLGAIAAIISAAGVFVNALQNLWIQYDARKEARESKQRGLAISAQVSAVDTKVEGVAENTNGHMTTLIAAVAPADPALAITTMAKFQAVAETVREKLEKGAEPPSELK